MGGLDQVLKDLMGTAERLLPSYLDYQGKKNALDTAESIYTSRYGNRYSGSMFGDPYSDGGSILPIVLIGGVVVVAAVLIAKA